MDANITSLLFILHAFIIQSEHQIFGYVFTMLWLKWYFLLQCWIKISTVHLFFSVWLLLHCKKYIIFHAYRFKFLISNCIAEQNIFSSYFPSWRFTYNFYINLYVDTLLFFILFYNCKPIHFWSKKSLTSWDQLGMFNIFFGTK